MTKYITTCKRTVRGELGKKVLMSRYVTQEDSLLDACLVMDADAEAIFGIALGSHQYCSEVGKALRAGEVMEFSRNLPDGSKVSYRVSPSDGSFGKDESYADFFLRQDGTTYGECYISACSNDHLYVVACMSADEKYLAIVSTDEGDVKFYNTEYPSAEAALRDGYRFLADSPELVMSCASKVERGEKFHEDDPEEPDVVCTGLSEDVSSAAMAEVKTLPVIEPLPELVMDANTKAKKKKKNKGKAKKGSEILSYQKSEIAMSIGQQATQLMSAGE